MSSSPNTDSPATANQFALLRQRRFAPFFWTQFCGAANDNIFKFALTVLVTYHLQLDWLPPNLAGLTIGALFILPFVLFSATAGQLADKFDKRTVMVAVKWFEIAIMGLASIGLWWGQVEVLLVCIFLMGLHSTLFGPAKYAYLPAHLKAHELTGGNGMVEMGTFVAILLGNVLGGALIAWPEVGPQAVAVACLSVAVLGRVAVHWVPSTPAHPSPLRIDWNPWRETRRNLAIAREDRRVFRAMLGISWMWFYGAIFLAQFPSFAKEVLHGDEHVALLLLTLFSIGLGVGSLWCERLSHGQVEIGLVPLGAAGMSLFALDIYFAAAQIVPPSIGSWSVHDFLRQPAHLRIVADLLGLSVSAGVYSVPLYALFQSRGRPSHMARLVAANNLLNALYMVASALIAGALVAIGWGVAALFGGLAVANAAMLGGLLWQAPEYAQRCRAWCRQHFAR